MWSILVERNELTANNNKWDVNNTKQWIWLVEHNRIAWEIARKGVDKTTIYDDVIGNYDNIWGGHLITWLRLDSCIGILNRLMWV